MKLKFGALIALFAFSSQVYASTAVIAGAAAAAGAAALSSMNRRQNFQLNASGVLDVVNKDVCDLTNDEYNRLPNCKPGDVVLMNFGEDKKVFQRIFKTCDLKEPVYILQWRIACVYEPKDVNIYRPKPVRKPKPAKELTNEEPKLAPEKRPSDHVE